MSTSTSNQPFPDPTTPSPPPSAISTQLPLAGRDPARNRRQAGLFFGGVAFVVFSSLITRRSLARRYKFLHATPPPTTGPLSKARPAAAPTGHANAVAEVRPAATTAATTTTTTAATAADSIAAEAQANGPILAVEALTVATMNVVSWAVMVAGGALWAFDVSTMEDARRVVRGGLGVDGTGRTEREAEEEMEEWLATVITRKEDRERVLRERERSGTEDEGWRNERGRER